jgi:hypothetical protein
MTCADWELALAADLLLEAAAVVNLQPSVEISRDLQRLLRDLDYIRSRLSNQRQAFIY